MTHPELVKGFVDSLAKNTGLWKIVVFRSSILLEIQWFSHSFPSLHDPRPGLFQSRTEPAYLSRSDLEDAMTRIKPSNHHPKHALKRRKTYENMPKKHFRLVLSDSFESP